jgi:hypothetical protein
MLRQCAEPIPDVAVQLGIERETTTLRDEYRVTLNLLLE